MSRHDFKVLIDDTSQHQVSVNVKEYVCFLTRLGVTFTTDVELWLSEHEQFGDLYFFTVYQAVHAFTKALVFGDVESLQFAYGCYSANECNIIVKNFNDQQWNRIVDRIIFYFNYLKFTQWDILYHWIIHNPVNTRVLNDVKTLLTEEKNRTDKFKTELRTDSLNKILGN